MKPWINENPAYYDYPIADIAGNPLIAALRPAPKDADEGMKRLQLKPIFRVEEVELPPSMRILLPDRLSSFMFPTDQHVKILNQIYPLVLEGYRYRNPVTVEGQRYLYEAGEETPLLNPVTSSPLVHPSKVYFLTGLSGVGKTTLINGIMRAMGKPVIRHVAFKGEAINETQIVYMARSIPDHCTTRALCKSFGPYADELLETSLYAKRVEGNRVSEVDCVATMRKIIKCYHVGALVFDNIQNLRPSKSKGYQDIVTLIINLCEELGVPIILIGTYEGADLLRSNASIASRLTAGGYQELARPGSSSDDEWGKLCEIMWKYQWIKNPVKLTDEIVDTLYDCSQGITRILLNLFITAQKEAIQLVSIRKHKSLNLLLNAAKSA